MIVVDTNVLQKANAPLEHEPKARRKIQHRLDLLKRIVAKEVKVLYSLRLMHEYRTQIPTPRNEYLRTFFEVLTAGGGGLLNWRTPWKEGRLAARECRYPGEDDHVLRTALHDEPTIIYTEEERMLCAGECIYRRLRVRIQDPCVD